MHRLTPILMVFPAVLLAVMPVSAQHMNEKDSPCANVVVTSDLVACLSNARTLADARLNAVYNNVLEHLRTRPDDAEQLRKTERLWLQYRDANCAAERDLYGGGTGGPPAFLACVEAMTRARTKELQTVYDWLVKK